MLMQPNAILSPSYPARGTKPGLANGAEGLSGHGGDSNHPRQIWGSRWAKVLVSGGAPSKGDKGKHPLQENHAHGTALSQSTAFHSPPYCAYQCE